MKKIVGWNFEESLKEGIICQVSEVVWNVSDIVVGMLRTFRTNNFFLCVLRFLDADSDVTDLSLCFTDLHGYCVINCTVISIQLKKCLMWGGGTGRLE